MDRPKEDSNTGKVDGEITSVCQTVQDNSELSKKNLR